ncbi:50S ribosomal protein L11 methyltransferase [Sphingomonas sp. S-NIH.Pt15_0812]|jgi:ribosomal protein L11 methyltransferase|uniref:50S ribosomal protein L11 methyltransferase n=1 Tax=Sphingomonas sp. S-NIH.Pt15_0812 TaxID=1920129 RepID=UPI000F7D88AC|nr:50S ribosomal protein L11 methyltransferase [Sphingomonas sp. S-NIH.Pt15_0812]RSU54612.1 50S ribosomal protein L11 methyltransferase [Sphingomonas sp. S-NIH.Pt15_0812]
MSDSWKISLPCTRAEAEAIDMADELIAGAVLMTTEEVEDDREHWRLDAYVEAEPDAALVAQVRALVPSAGDRPATVTHLPPEDWVTLSQAGLEPLSVGRFFVHSGAATVPADVRAFHIPAGRAFGTGHHETTSGCLAMLDGLAERRFASAIDVGTGTGLLAFAVAHLWPQARIVATDIDPVAIEVTAENAALNQVEGIDLIVADGALADSITERAPYDLVIANILAGPLVSMAPELAAIAGPSATIVLAGLLETQRAEVVAAYQACGCTLEAVDRRGDWSVLRLTAGAERFVPAGPFDPKGRDGWALDL